MSTVIQVCDLGTEPVDSAAPPAARPPLPCRWHLWHRWVRVRVEAGTSYVACARCERLATPTLFEPPVP